MSRSQLRHPTCTKCCYNLTGINPVDKRYTCPECGTSVGQREAMTAPSDTGRYARPILIGAVPPIGVLLLVIIPIFVPSDINTQAQWAGRFLAYSLIAPLWPFFVAMHYMFKFRRVETPTEWSGSIATFANIFFGALGTLGFVLVLPWMLVLAIYLGSQGATA